MSTRPPTAPRGRRVDLPEARLSVVFESDAPVDEPSYSGGRHLRQRISDELTLFARTAPGETVDSFEARLGDPFAVVRRIQAAPATVDGLSATSVTIEVVRRPVRTSDAGEGVVVHGVEGGRTTRFEVIGLVAGAWPAVAGAAVGQRASTAEEAAARRFLGSIRRLA